MTAVAVSNSSFPDVRELLPHAGTMVWLDEVVSWELGAIVCTATVRRCGEATVNQVVDSIVTIEHMGQAVAACFGMEAFSQGEGARVGMIIGCRQFEVLATALIVGSKLVVSAKLLRGNEQMSHFECEARVGESPVARATLMLFHPAIKNTFSEATQ